MDKEKEYIEREYFAQKSQFVFEIDTCECVLVDDILKAPAADVRKVVRCRDCVFNMSERADGKINCYKNIRLVEPEHFCGWGKKEGAGDG